MQTPINFKIKLLQFYRDNNGTALYQHGLRDVQYEFALMFELLDTANNKVMNEYDRANILSMYEGHFFEAQQRFKNAVLLDNDDAFFRNMVAPHMFDTFNDKFSDEEPMFFTPDVTPPPTRLLFPMLVGHDQNNLQHDLEGFVVNYLTEIISRIKVTIGPTTFVPDYTIKLVSSTSSIDSPLETLR